MERIRFDLANGIITSWNANFTIYDSTGVVKTVQGTESLPATTITATCSQVIGPYGIPAQHFVVIATVTYQATIYGTGGSITTDSGTSLTTLDFVLVPDFGYGNISIGTFTESFSPAGCNGTGGGQGNDSCSGQNGGNGQN